MQPLAELRHGAGSADQDQHNHVTPEAIRDTSSARSDRTDVSADTQGAPSTTWVRAEDLQSFVLLQAGHGRADREQLRQALWADLEAVDG